MVEVGGEAHLSSLKGAPGTQDFVSWKVHVAVTHSVAMAAMESGVAKRQLDDDYFEDNTLTAPLWE